MAANGSLKFLEDKWDEAVASKFDAPELLRYRSNLLGSDLRITAVRATVVCPAVSG